MKNVSPPVGHRWWLLIAAASAIVAVQPTILAVIVGLVFAIATWRWPNAALGGLAFCVLAVRPSLDAFGERAFGISVLALNPAVVFGLVVLLGASVIAIRRARDGAALWPDPAVRNAHLWLFAAYLIGFASGARLYGLPGATTAAREIVRVASIVFAFLLVTWWIADHPNRVRDGLRWLLVGAVPPVIVALTQALRGTGNLELEGVNRLQGTFSHPNSFGVYLVPFVLFIFASIGSRRGVNRMASLVGGLGLSLLILLTYSRTALLVLLAGLAVLPFVQRRMGWSAVAKAAVLGLILMTIGFFVAGDLIRERFASVSLGREAWDAAMAGESENSFTWRLINWAILAQMSTAHPFFGHGSGMTTVLNPLVNASNGVPFNAHNDFVRFLFEAGAIGLGCYLVYAALICRWALARARESELSRAPMAYGVAAALVSVVFLSLGTTELSLNTAILYQLYGMLALIGAPTWSRKPNEHLVGARTHASDQPLP